MHSILLFAVSCNRVAVKPNAAETPVVTNPSPASIVEPRVENDYLVFANEQDMVVYLHHLYDMPNEDRLTWEKGTGFYSLKTAYQVFSRYSEASAEKGYGMTIPELRAKHPYLIIEDDGTFEEDCIYPLLSYICNSKGQVKIGGKMVSYTKTGKEGTAISTSFSANKIETSTCVTPINVNVGAWYGSGGYTSIVPERVWTSCSDKFKLKASCDNYQTYPTFGTGLPIYDELTISMKSYKKTLGVYYAFSTNLSTTYSGSFESGPTSPAIYTHTFFGSKFTVDNNATFVLRSNYNGASSSSPSYLPVFPIGPEYWNKICLDATVSYVTSGTGSCGAVTKDLL